MAQRMRRVNELMREVIGSAITSELQDPRIGFVTVTSVDTSPDLRSARVYVSVLGDEVRVDDDKLFRWQTILLLVRQPRYDRMRDYRMRHASSSSSA